MSEFPEWQIDDLAAKIDPKAFYDDSKVLGSVPGRRESARRKAIEQLRKIAERDD